MSSANLIDLIERLSAELADVLDYYCEDGIEFGTLWMDAIQAVQDAKDYLETTEYPPSIGLEHIIDRARANRRTS